ncbi:MAG: hypothetical protein WA906_12090 [Pacificimonas sp.]
MDDEYKRALNVEDARRLRDSLREQIKEANRKLKQAENDGKAAVRKHRTWHVAALGNAFLVRGLAGEDAAALEGFLASKAKRLQDRLEKAVQDDRDTTMGDVIVAAIEAHKDDLKAHGERIIWQRNFDKYHADKRAWIEAEPGVDGAWRRKRATKEQRWLILRTCETADLPVPALSTRGAASDWLDENDANLSYPKLEGHGLESYNG